MILRLFLFSRLVPDFCDGRRSFQTNWKLKFVSSGTSAMDFAHYQSPKLLGSSPPITQVSIFGALSISGQIHRENPHPGGYSGFQVTGMIEGFFGVWNFRFWDFFGYENLVLFVMFWPGLVLFRVIYNVTVETKPFLGVSSTRSSLLKWLPEEGKDIFRWYDKKTNTSVQFPMFSFVL